MEESIVAGPAIQLPIIDISNPDDPAVGKTMLDAAAKYGFLYVDSRGSDFTPDDVKRAFGLVRYACSRGHHFIANSLLMHSRRTSSCHLRRTRQLVGSDQTCAQSIDSVGHVSV